MVALDGQVDTSAGVAGVVSVRVGLESDAASASSSVSAVLLRIAPTRARMALRSFARRVLAIR